MYSLGHVCHLVDLDFGHSGLAPWGIATAPTNRAAPKAPIISAQPSGLGNRTAEAKALKARAISIPGITLVEFGLMLKMMSFRGSPVLGGRDTPAAPSDHPAAGPRGPSA